MRVVSGASRLALADKAWLLPVPRAHRWKVEGAQHPGSGAAVDCSEDLVAQSVLWPESCSYGVG